jgi:diguanylate cyclase (GGDEF)-like protein
MIRAGHPVGDQLLEQIAQKLQQMARKSDLLARFGGDEFVLAIPEASVEQGHHGRRTATGSRAIRGAARAWTGGTRSRPASASLYSPNDGEEPEQVIANADLAMYQAKSKGAGPRPSVFGRGSGAGTGR